MEKPQHPASVHPGRAGQPVRREHGLRRRLPGGGALHRHACGGRHHAHPGRDLLARAEGREAHRHLHRRTRSRAGAGDAGRREASDGAALRGVGVRRSQWGVHHRRCGGGCGGAPLEERLRHCAGGQERAGAGRYRAGRHRLRRAGGARRCARAARQQQRAGSCAGRVPDGARALQPGGAARPGRCRLPRNAVGRCAGGDRGGESRSRGRSRPPRWRRRASCSSLRM